MWLHKYIIINLVLRKHSRCVLGDRICAHVTVLDPDRTVLVIIIAPLLKLSNKYRITKQSLDITVKSNLSIGRWMLNIHKRLESELADKLNQKSINSASLCVDSFPTHTSSCSCVGHNSVPRSTNRFFPFTPLALVLEECGQRFQFSIWKPDLDQFWLLRCVTTTIFILTEFPVWETIIVTPVRQARKSKMWIYRVHSKYMHNFY